MNDYNINKDIYTQISGATENVTLGYYDDNTQGNALYYTFSVKEPLDALDIKDFARYYDIKVKIISSSIQSLYNISKTVTDNLKNGEYLYLQYVTFENDNYYYDPYIKKHTLTLGFTAYVSN